jgi:hypothetical protein
MKRGSRNKNQLLLLVISVLVVIGMLCGLIGALLESRQPVMALVPFILQMVLWG